MLRNLFFGSSPSNVVSEDSPLEVEDDQPRNPFDQISILSAHSDIVDRLIKLNKSRILSAGQDKKGIVWDCKSGELLCELVGHVRTISCAILLDNYMTEFEGYSNVVVTGSSDQTIRVWESSNGNCCKVITNHESAVKCFTCVDSDLVVSGGQNICLWNNQFKLLTQYQRNSLDYVHTIIVVQGMRIVTASDQKFLIVYDISQLQGDIETDVLYRLKKATELAPHRESITSLIKISEATFASASMDGVIVIWSSLHLAPYRKFNHYDDFMSLADHTYPYSVQHLLPVEESYLIAAIGCGFAIYNIIKDECILKVKNAHQSQVTCIQLLEGGSYLATSSLDGTVRLWSAPLDKTQDIVSTSTLSTLFNRNMKDTKSSSQPLILNLVGVCYAHSNSVQSMVEFEDDGFVSLSNDGLIILWKNGKVMQQKSDLELRTMLRKFGWLDEH